MPIALLKQRSSALALKAKGLRLVPPQLHPRLTFSTGPESKGIETKSECEFPEIRRSALALKAKGLRRGYFRRSSRRIGFSTGPESKGIETLWGVLGRLVGKFSTGPESKGIDTRLPVAFPVLNPGSALALKAKGLRPDARKGIRFVVQHWP